MRTDAPGPAVLLWQCWSLLVAALPAGAGPLPAIYPPQTSQVVVPASAPAQAGPSWRVPGRPVAAGSEPAATTDVPATQPSSASAPAGKKRLSVDIIFGPQGKVDFGGKTPQGLTWLPDGWHYLERRDGKLLRVATVSGGAGPAYDSAALEQALLAQGDFDAAAAGRLARDPGAFAPDRSAVLIEHNDRLYWYRFDEGRVRRLTPHPARRRVVEISPRGRFVSFVLDNDLYTIEVRSGRVHRLTRDGGPARLNGILDWVYQEELYGRGQWRGHWWRDDEKYLAYLQLDEADVPLYTIVDPTTTRPAVETTRYPKAGDPNPRVRLGVVRSGGGATRWVDLSGWTGIDILIVRVGWAPDGRLIFQVQDREQRWLELVDADPRTGRVRTLLREQTPAWVNVLGQPHFLPDHSFLWLSERDGFAHLYLYTRDGRLIRPITSGAWEVRELHGFDSRGGWVYFSGTRDDRLETHAYRVRLDGSDLTRLTEPGWTHAVDFDPHWRFFFDRFSNVSTPPRVYLRHASGALARVLSDNLVPELDEYDLSPPQFVTVPARDGFPLQALLILPTAYDPDRRYPVWGPIYGGPQSPQVVNRWMGEGGMLHQMLAQQGYIVWLCDPRSAGHGQGAAAAWTVYQRLGEVELRDLEDGLQWLIDQGYADPRRIGLTGHSYGGFLTAYALTHSGMFRIGVASAPVTDWRLYDSIYTERYMRTPANNPEGYDRSSVVLAAENLAGRLLLAHGLVDDNVHFQNTLQLISALQKAGKRFELMVYPHDRHGIIRGGRHLRELRLEYLYQGL